MHYTFLSFLLAFQLMSLKTWAQLTPGSSAKNSSSTSGSKAASDTNRPAQYNPAQSNQS